MGIAVGLTACIQGPRHNVHTAQSETTQSTTVAAAPASTPTTTTTATATATTKVAASPLLGKMAPEIAVDDWVGTTTPVLLRDQIGRIVVLVFCKLDDPQCASTHERMKTFQESYAKDGVVNVELMIDQEDDAAGWKRISEKIASQHLPWAVGYGGRVDYTRLRYGIEDVPAVFVVDSDGKMVWSGAPGPELDQVLAKVVKQGP